MSSGPTAVSPSERLAALELALPGVAAPVASYVPATRVGDQVWTSGQLPFVEGALVRTGKVGAEVSLEEAQQDAKVAVLNALAAAAEVAGGLDRITRILKVSVFVASAPGFTAQPAVANGASDLLGEVFGEAGSHVRAAVGVAVLPLDSPVEIELVVQA